MRKLDPKSLQDLEFDQVLHQISQRCITDIGKAQIIDHLPFTALESVLLQLKQVREFQASINSDSPIPNHGFESIQKEIELLGIENSTLQLPSFRRIQAVGLTTGELIKYFKKNREFFVALWDYSEEVTYTSLITDEIGRVIDRYGFIRDDASDELKRIRRSLIQVKSRINSSFDQALNRYHQKDLLDEIRESVVDNRRVLAVKAMHRKKVAGIPLGTSKTGSIVYMQPRETQAYADELANLLYEESEEIKRILKELTEFIRPYEPLLTQYQAYLTHLDTLYGRARYAEAIGGIIPIAGKERRLKLIDAFHPLLYAANKLEGKKTWPQSIELHPENRIIVISGPNAGGKSITLKTIGLLQLMWQSGIPVPCDPLSEFCIFERVLTDIGDNQSIENHLSTYSYRLKRMNQFLKKCNSKTLLLIDEFGTGSDPELGGALAETFLEVFYEKEAYGVITTHYANLKLLASELPHATNANMQFDRRSLEPMFQLQLGEAGSSFTFEVAQKNGIPYSLINKAKKKIERGKVRFDRTIANLQKERSALRKTSASLKDVEEKAREESLQMEKTNKRIQNKLERYQELFDANQRLISLGKKFDQLAERYHNNKKKRELIDELVKLTMVENSKRKKVSPKRKKVQKQQQQQLKQEVDKKVEKIRQRKKKEKEATKAPPPPKPKVKLKVGDQVRMIDGRAVGTIETIERNKAAVNYGVFMTSVNLSELEKA
ncbi:endonuclease MutS2 [Aureitalea marina]|uniref:DNA mismatch repair protein MutS n=1 Tax=Aureitalea marina TaxID=930804 RepID=A0A2S7KP49_9FLAO|nr:DNA mismatch repair protein MutS [Aureitalea marina]PQB04377.1 DNA mismatch repair protein MutS [Aureitalea marina]